MYFVLQPKLTATQKEDEYTKEQNKKLLQEKEKLESDITQLLLKVSSGNEEVHKAQIEVEKLKVQEAEIKKRHDVLVDQINKDNELIYQKSFDLMQEKLSHAAEQESEKFRMAQREAEEEYLRVLEEIALSTADALNIKREEIRVAETQLMILKAKADAVVNAARREEEKLLEIDKYKILVTDLDLLEINRLREIAPYFRNARAIYKIVWESYYRNLTTEMINRVIGIGIHTGIYKITNLTNQKIYIGQAVNLADRWKEHIKCGLGIDTPNNILYKAMMKDGVENFTFEVLEECERDQLNDREKYYISFYGAQDWGYNMSRGGARN